MALNGEPEEGISVQATGIGSPACTQLVEESLSEANGLFCIRGLQPQVSTLQDYQTFVPEKVL